MLQMFCFTSLKHCVPVSTFPQESLNFLNYTVPKRLKRKNIHNKVTNELDFSPICREWRDHFPVDQSNFTTTLLCFALLCFIYNLLSFYCWSLPLNGFLSAIYLCYYHFRINYFRRSCCEILLGRLEFRLPFKRLVELRGHQQTWSSQSLIFVYILSGIMSTVFFCINTLTVL